MSNLTKAGTVLIPFSRSLGYGLILSLPMLVGTNTLPVQRTTWLYIIYNYCSGIGFIILELTNLNLTLQKPSFAIYCFYHDFRSKINTYLYLLNH